MPVESPLRELLDLASRAPSGHNTQPWTLVRTGERRLVLRSESSRWLPMVDPANRELLLSFGALIENIRLAAPAVGYRAEVQVLANQAQATYIAQVELAAVPSAPSNTPTLIRSRATTRTPFLPAELSSSDVNHLLGLDRTALSFVRRESPEGRWLADATAEAFARQTWDDRKQGELAEWLRFSRRDVRTRGDGLTPEALGQPGLVRVLWYAAFSRRQALSPSFRRASIQGTRRHLEGCSGFLVITSADRSVKALLDAGALYQRALLRATDLGVAHHTMSQALEEDPWRQEVDRSLSSERPVQFIIRLGRAKRLAQPSVRRSVAGVFEDRGGPPYG